METTEYAKHLEDENTALRRAMNRMEDEIKRLSKELENTALTEDDLRGMIVTNFSYGMPTNQISFGNQTYHVQGRSAGEMTIQFDTAEQALRLKFIIDKANNVK